MRLVVDEWLGRPLSSGVGVRRSTVLLFAAFVGLGALYYQVRSTTTDVDEVYIVIPATTTSVAPD